MYMYTCSRKFKKKDRQKETETERQIGQKHQINGGYKNKTRQKIMKKTACGNKESCSGSLLKKK